MEIRKDFDSSILLLSVVLTCLGVVMVYSASSIMAEKKFADGFYFLKKQGLFALIGFMVMAIAMQIDYRHLQKLVFPIMFGSTVLLGLVLVPGIGTQIGGAARWIRLPGLTVQPAEVVKLALVIYMAHSLSQKGEKLQSFRQGVLPYMLVLGILLSLLLAQPDLGSALTLAGLAVVMMTVAGSRVRYLFLLALPAIPALYFLVMNVDYRRRRIFAFLDPWDDPTNTGFQIIQSWIAFGSGGLFGNGLGESKQKLFYLPEAHTDFIFSVIGEELGFAGVLVIS
ncbi:MAG: stage V sporulation protein E, partial [Desulfuromonas sp.]